MEYEFDKWQSALESGRTPTLIDLSVLSHMIASQSQRTEKAAAAFQELAFVFTGDADAQIRLVKLKALREAVEQAGLSDQARALGA